MKTIEITTTQQVTIEYELAPYRERILSALIDALVVGAINIIIGFIYAGIMSDDDFNNFSPDRFWQLYILIFMLYHFLSELLMDGQSLGKRTFGIKVIKLNGKEAGPNDYFLRSLFYIIDGFFSMAVLGSMLIISTEKSQRMGDFAANTAIIKVKFNLRFRLEDILKINSLADYEPLYPDVRQFTEQDMLLIKSVIARHREYNNSAHKEVVNNLVRDLMLKLDIIEEPRDKIHFLKTLIRDYIVLTR